MEGRMKLLFLFMLGAAWACDARELANPDLLSSNIAKSDTSAQTRRPDICALCEVYTEKAIDYLNENKTQEEIIDYLHNACLQLHSFKQQCITLVDYYAPLFFLELSSIQPGEFCKKVDLCEQIARISSQIEEDSCGLCKDAVSALMVKLEDPKTQLEIIETLIKMCSSLQNYAKKCKKLVFEYGPVILINAEKFLETTDICKAIHACKASSSTVYSQAQEFIVMEEAPLLSVS
ncbi:prosaposin [Senna tora]|uniref:Pulmonary surfactant-associated protein B n=1 Tax=Senna tora TaxID=362788 RepID=A0A834TNB5_9FABA|nr:prosaposin [Senna tora]